ncbi:MAG: NAD-dependent succinate-semialdehyde dehydrogenase [Gemmatimonadaceae bacterium]|nr:NAD-dependent succinate-semialdehyde dehydrogenase [Gemmatimonadaceae bacterium]
MIQTVNPANGQVVRTFDPHTGAVVEEKLGLAAKAFWRLRKMSFADRAERMRSAAAILIREKQSLGELMTLEMGKPIKAAIAEAEKCASACSYYADNAERFLADRKIEIEKVNAWVAYQPLGVVLAVMPWNFPLWQVFRFAAPALMAGNVGVLKHASNVPQCALAIEDIFRRAGFDEGCFQALLVGSEAVAKIIADKRIVAVTLTGSEGAGRSVAEQAGKHLKKTVLELGGSDPFIVMPSCDLESAVATAVTARMINNGQSCIAAKRFIVHADVYDPFVSRFAEAVRAIRVGDPMDEANAVGPLATSAIRDELHEQVRRTVSAGAKILTGGRSLPGAGWYYEPTVLTDIPDGSPAASEELFGPVASVFRAKDVRHAIEIANSTRFGLGASAWTNDAAERALFVREIEAGVVFINDMVASDTRLPFGGVKSSGYGRELSDIGIREFVNVKTVRIVEPRNQAAKRGRGQTE